MTQRDRLESYLEGWRNGDPARSLAATAPGFFYDDPATGRVSQDGFIQFFNDFMAAGAALTGGTLADPFLTFSDVTIVEGQPGIAWCWWQITGTEFRGTACIRFDDSGVLSERIAYFTDTPRETPLPGTA